MHKIRKALTQLKNDNVVLFYIWTEFIRLKGIRKLKQYTDVEAINKLYYAKSGRFPNIENPTLFSEKMQWLKLYYRDATMEIAADKFKVRELVKEKGYEGTLNTLYAVFDDVSQVNIEELPEQFVLKASHGSGWNLIVSDKSKINWFWWKKILKSWLKHNIFWNGREWVYKRLKPRLVCEQFLTDKSGYLTDYKFHCFNGEPKYIQANNGRGKKQHAQNFYDLNWRFLPFGKDLTPIKDVEIPRPTQLKERLKMAREYASDYPYVRADFYEVNGKIIFGELTFFPASGMPDFKPAKYDTIWGDLLELPHQKYKKNII